MATAAEQIIEQRVLFVAPTARDAEITSDLLKSVALECVVYRNIGELIQPMIVGAGAILLTDEAVIGEAADLLLAALGRQPAWSDLPVVLMAHDQSQRPAVVRLLQSLTNVTVLERPAPIRSVISAVQAAVRGRVRQYQIRAQFAAIRDAEQRLAFAMEAGKLGTWEVDLTRLTFTCSPGCKQIFGRGLDEFSYQDLLAVIHPEHRTAVIDAMELAVVNRTEYLDEYRIIWADGSEHWVSSHGRADYAEGGRPVRMAGVVLDISDRKHSEQQRQSLLEGERSARTEAERVGRMKDEFLATLSHELRTPLNAILGWSHLLQMSQANPDDVKEGLAAIERNARAQTELIDDLLDMSRIISGKIRMEFKLISPATVIRAAIATVQPAAAAKGVKIDADVDLDAGNITADPGRLQQIVWNLLSNAIKFTERGGTVRINLRRRSSQMEIEVTDSGQGIDPEFLPHVFERFRQADSKTTREHGGLGLGLAIVKHLVELHGGNIVVTSAGKGTGAAFTIQLPITPIQVTETDQSVQQIKQSNRVGAPAPSADFSGVKVLVVDDEPDARQLLKRVLQGSYANVLVAGSAAEALAAVVNENPDLIISDIGMPTVDGYDLIRQVRALGHSRGQVPAIALTAFARSEDRERALIAGFSRHLTKPVDASELLATIAALTDRAMK